MIAILSLLTALSLPVSAQELSDEQTGLVKESGWELARAQCGGSHPHRIVTNHKDDRQTWPDTIRWMQATHNHWQFEPTTESGILDYLTRNYPPQPNRRRVPILPSLMPSEQQGRTSQ